VTTVLLTAIFQLSELTPLMAEPISSEGAMSSMTISEQDQGSELRVHVGDELTLRLSAIPGTGYSWNVSGEDRGVLVEIGEPTFERTSDVPRLGAPEQQVFRFRVGSAGVRQLRLEYRRPWDKLGMAAKTFSMTVVAQE
jgi:predicted secreted protein